MNTPTIKNISMYWLYYPETPYVKITLTIRGTLEGQDHVYAMPLPQSPSVSEDYIKKWVFGTNSERTDTDEKSPTPDEYLEMMPVNTSHDGTYQRMRLRGFEEDCRRGTEYFEKHAPRTPKPMRPKT